MGSVTMIMLRSFYEEDIYNYLLDWSPPLNLYFNCAKNRVYYLIQFLCFECWRISDSVQFLIVCTNVPCVSLMVCFAQPSIYKGIVCWTDQSQNKPNIKEVSGGLTINRLNLQCTIRKGLVQNFRYILNHEPNWLNNAWLVCVPLVIYTFWAN